MLDLCEDVSSAFFIVLLFVSLLDKEHLPDLCEDITSSLVFDW